MRIALVSLIALCFMAPCLASAGDLSALSSSANAQGDADEGGQFMIPKWRLAVRTYGNDGGNPAIGVYHRMGSRNELGLAIDGDMDFTDRERSIARGDSSTSFWVRSDGDEDAFSVVLYGELRRWNRISDGLMWYLGPRLALGYSYRDYQNNYDEEHEYWDEIWSYKVGIMLSAGADLTLLKRLSVTVGFVPVGLTHVWSEYKSGYVGDDGAIYGDSVDKTRVLELELHPYATAYLCLTF